jgi:hypothetical protein
VERKEIMPIEFDGDLDELLARFGKGKKAERTPPRASKPGTRPKDVSGRDKAFVAFHYSDGTDHESHSYLQGRNSLCPATIHFFLRPNDSWNKVLADGREEKKFHPDRVVVVHNHAWNETCTPAPAKAKCKEIVLNDKKEEDPPDNNPTEPANNNPIAFNF